jgi:AraC-like DNA-binding protein
MTSALTAGLSGGFIALVGLLGLLACRDARAALAGRLLAGLCASVAALELTTGPIGDSLPAGLWTPLRVIGGFNIALLWLFCLAVLRDSFRIRRLEQVGFVLFSLGPLATMVDWGAAPGAGLRTTLIALAPLLAIGHIGWVALWERGGDLVEGRQRGRVWLIGLLATAALVSVVSENLPDSGTATLVRIALAGIPVVIVAHFWLTSLQPGRLLFEPAVAAEVRAKVDPRDQSMLAALVETMDAGLYREPGLTIERLAETLRTPTHRLRVVINQGLGHRNFAAFVNGYRLTYAKAALSDPARGRETVLAIAYESGFAALQSFNRVFKDAEGETPTGFRERRLRETAQNQMMLPNSGIE